MSNNDDLSILEGIRRPFKRLVERNLLLDADISILAKPLTPEEAIGIPGRRDFPIIIGKERILEAIFRKAKGHAFTDAAREFAGTIAEVLELPFTSNQNRAIYVATVNAVLRHLGQVTATVHCKDDDPEICGAKIAHHILEKHGRVAVGLIGLNPAIADNLIQVFGSDSVHITDLHSDNIGKKRFGVLVWDGAEQTNRLVKESDVVLMTGTTIQNGTFDEIWEAIQAHGKKGLVYGVTAAGVCAIAGIERICPCGRDD